MQTKTVTVFRATEEEFEDFMNSTIEGGYEDHILGLAMHTKYREHWGEWLEYFIEEEMIGDYAIILNTERIAVWFADSYFEEYAEKSILAHEFGHILWMELADNLDEDDADAAGIFFLTEAGLSANLLKVERIIRAQNLLVEGEE